MHIIINKHFLKYKDHKFRCSIGKSGFNRSKKEGDFTTPIGEFKLGALYFRKDRIKSVKSKLKKKIIKKNMGWCDDTKSKKYNQEISLPFRYGAEKLFKKDSSYDIFINIKYNQNPIKKGKGSAIFLHLTNKKYKPTHGCIAVLKKDLLKILPHINKKTKISIT
jgi:L,D-peptidoglycan transpeptidase YkuD (ErfK/YbiS/YcfS/YnhG family)|tara:strand:- start:95 stop:586 length:492 start_codon:yes stop_codon:yes gene_type:complete